MKLSTDQKNLIASIKNCKRYTVTRFELHSSTQPDLISTALNFVHLDDIHETMETVKQRGDLIRNMSESGLIRVCFHLPVSARSDFQVYLDSDLFQQLCELVEEGKQKPDFLFDTPAIQRGVLTVTEKGRQAFLASKD